jgi:hypothetical protein
MSPKTLHFLRRLLQHSQSTSGPVILQPYIPEPVDLNCVICYLSNYLRVFIPLLQRR